MRGRGSKGAGGGGGGRKWVVRRLGALLLAAPAPPRGRSRRSRGDPQGRSSVRPSPSPSRPASAPRGPNMAQDVSDYLRQHPRAAAWVEALRGDGETDKQWRHRREFLLRNAGDLVPPDGEGAGGDGEGDAASESGPRRRRRRLQQLVSFSLAWANHVFLGCR